MSRSLLLTAFLLLAMAACGDTEATPATSDREDVHLTEDVGSLDQVENVDVPAAVTDVPRPPVDGGPSPQTDTEEPEISAGVQVRPCDDVLLELSTKEREALASADFTQCATPFGVLLAADAQMPASYVNLAAQVLAELLDQDIDGVVDDPLVGDAVANHQVAWLAMPMDPNVWEASQLPALGGALGYDIVIPAWWLDLKPGGPDSHGRAVIVEEVHHFLTQFGYSEVYPEAFGVNDWSSVIAQETAKAQCDFWQHPENDCPGSPAEYPGDCGGPSCDVVEFYQQVAVLRAGMTPGWFGIGFPKSSEALEQKLSQALKDIMDAPEHHQLKAPLTFAYPLD